MTFWIIINEVTDISHIVLRYFHPAMSSGAKPKNIYFLSLSYLYFFIFTNLKENIIRIMKGK